MAVFKNTAIRSLVWVALFLVLAASALGAQQTSPYRVRIAYVIPSDRQPRANYRLKAGVLLERVRNFYADQMERNGFGRMTFDCECGQDGGPEVHLIRSPLKAAAFADGTQAKYTTGKAWSSAFQAMIDGGFAPDAAGEVWLCFVEAQDQAQDGSIRNDVSQGAGRFGNGCAICSGLALTLGGDPDLIHDDRNYGNLVLPAIGPHPLLLHISFPSYQGDDVSSLAACSVGAVAHELGHCFLLQHCYLDDAPHCGNVMGNGFRGWRGYFLPSRFPDEDCRLDRPSALILSLNPFFRKPSVPIPYSAPPLIELHTPPGDMHLSHGALSVSFTASEPAGPGISLAILENGLGRDGVGVVAWKEFDGKSKEVHATIETNAVNPALNDTWRLTVLDSSGNVAYQTLKLKAPRYGIAPHPILSVSRTYAKVGDTVHFRGSVQRPLRFEYGWSFGDGAAGEGPAIDHVFTKPGLYEVRLTATDPGGRIGQISQFIWVEGKAN